METRLFLVVLLATFAKAELEPGDAKVEISADLVRGLNLTCTIREVYGLLPISIVLSRTDTRNNSVNGSNVASVSYNGRTNTFPGASMNYIIHSFDYHWVQSTFLALTWDDLESFSDGDYTCTFYGLGQDNIPRAITKKTTIKVSDLDPVAKARPENIKDGLDKSFLVQCTSVSLAFHGLSKPCTLEIFHTNAAGTQERIASADYDDSNSTKTSVNDGWEVISVYTTDQIVILEVSKEGYPTISQAGTYTCIITTNQTTVELVKTTQVTASAATRDEIYEMTVDDDIKGFHYWGCNFERGMCGLKISNPQNEPNWNRIQGRFAGWVDHTRGDGFGYLARVELPAKSSLVPTLRTKEQPTTHKRTCLSFWLYMVGSNTQMSIYAKSSSSEYVNYLTSFSGTSSWNRKQVTIYEYNTNEIYSVEFRFSNNNTYYYNGYSSYQNYYDGYALLDDIVITDINCN